MLLSLGRFFLLDDRNLSGLVRRLWPQLRQRSFPFRSRTRRESNFLLF